MKLSIALIHLACIANVAWAAEECNEALRDDCRARNPFPATEPCERQSYDMECRYEYHCGSSFAYSECTFFADANQCENVESICGDGDDRVDNDDDQVEDDDDKEEEEDDRVDDGSADGSADDAADESEEEETPDELDECDRAASDACINANPFQVLNESCDWTEYTMDCMRKNKCLARSDALACWGYVSEVRCPWQQRQRACSMLDLNDFPANEQPNTCDIYQFHRCLSEITRVGFGCYDLEQVFNCRHEARCSSNELEDQCWEDARDASCSNISSICDDTSNLDDNCDNCYREYDYYGSDDGLDHHPRVSSQSSLPFFTIPGRCSRPYLREAAARTSYRPNSSSASATRRAWSSTSSSATWSGARHCPSLSGI